MTTGLHHTNAGAVCQRTGKIMFASPNAADRRRKTLRRRRDEKLSTYRCKFCKYWHLGHPVRDRD